MNKFYNITSDFDINNFLLFKYYDMNELIYLKNLKWYDFSYYIYLLSKIWTLFLLNKFYSPLFQDTKYQPTIIVWRLLQWSLNIDTHISTRERKGNSVLLIESLIPPPFSGVSILQRPYTLGIINDFENPVLSTLIIVFTCPMCPRNLDYWLFEVYLSFIQIRFIM